MPVSRLRLAISTDKLSSEQLYSLNPLCLSNLFVISCYCNHFTVLALLHYTHKLPNKDRFLLGNRFNITLFGSTQ